MSLFRRALVLLAWAALAFATPAAARDVPAARRTVILISLDGVSRGLMMRSQTPALDQLAAEGAAIARLIPPFPSNTFPSHATMATGSYPARHGIVNNKFMDRKLGPFDKERSAFWLRAQPLWVTAERQNVRAGVIMWVTSEGDWRGALPSFQMKFNRRTDDDRKVERILSWLSLPPRERPRLIMAWFRGSDAECHRYGPFSQEAVAQLEREDALIGRLREGLKRRGLSRSTALIVASDHGAIPLGRVLNLDRALRKGGLRGRVATAGGVSNIYLEAPWERDRAIRILSAQKGFRLYPREELPRAWHATAEGRLGDLVAVAEPGIWFSEGPDFIAGGTRKDRVGGHGYPPGVPGTDGLLIGAGPGIRRGARIPSAQMVDVYPTLCRLLGIRPARGIDGRALDAMLGGGRAESAGSSPGEPS
ncbi:MAG: alkaline phosphatase family protein [Myxococcota bacterium]